MAFGNTININVNNGYQGVNNNVGNNQECENRPHHHHHHHDDSTKDALLGAFLGPVGKGIGAATDHHDDDDSACQAGNAFKGF